MKTYVALLDGGRREEPVEVKRLSAGVFEVKLRGRVHVVDAFRHDYGTLSLVVDTASYSAMLDWRDTAVNVRLRHSTFPLELLDEKRLRLGRTAARHGGEGRRLVTAPAAGRVARILVRPGDEVKRGQRLVVVERAGAEHEVLSPKDGKVVELLVAEGQAVDANAKLCAVE